MDEDEDEYGNEDEGRDGGDDARTRPSRDDEHERDGVGERVEDDDDDDDERIRPEDENVDAREDARGDAREGTRRSRGCVRCVRVRVRVRGVTVSEGTCDAKAEDVKAAAAARRGAEARAPASNASTAQWRIYTDIGRGLVREGKVDEARKYLERALVEAKRGFGEATRTWRRRSTTSPSCAE